MTGAACSFTALCERNLKTGGLDPQELRAFEGHLAAGCASCEALIEEALLGSSADEVELRALEELERQVKGAFSEAAGTMDPGRSGLLHSIREELLGTSASVQRRRRRFLRSLFFITLLLGIALLSAAYFGTLLATRVERVAAERLATEVELLALSRALAQHHKTHDQLPRDMAQLLEQLASPRSGSRQPYYPLAPARLEDAEYFDGFGRPYRLRVELGRVLIYSVGPNGDDESPQGLTVGGDDLGEWVTFVRERK